MRITYASIIGLASAVTSHSVLHPRETSILENVTETVGCTTVQCRQDALAFAFTYGFPLYPFGSLVQKDLPLPLNILLRGQGLRSAEDREVVRPNADTVYTNLFIDLSKYNLEITVPDFGDRYGVWPIYDMYGNNIANIGSAANVTKGKFLLHFDQYNIGLSIEHGSGDYDGYIGMPTAYGQSIIRTVTTNTTEDLEIVQEIQKKMQVRAIPRSDGSIAPPFDINVFGHPYYRAGNGTSLEEAVLRLTAVFAPYNEPEVVGDRGWVAQELRDAGIENGTFTQPPGTNLTAAFAAANESVVALLTQPGYVDILGNDWTMFDERIIGDYHSYYQGRFLIANWGYLALTSDQALYPANDAVTEIPANKAILVGFSRRPVLKNTGFWSLTLYGADLFFVPNELGRYALGDRSNLTYPDGTPVYTDDENQKNDGPFEILIQAEDVPPLKNWTNNWLPSASGGGTVNWNLRWYGAGDAMKSGGDYVYPKVSLIEVVTG